MKTLVLYDIQDDKARKKITSILKDYGLVRIQFSAFTGHLSTNRRQELMLKLSQFLVGQEGNIQIFAMCSRDEELIVEIDHTGYAARRYM